jgi:anti-anti-sigma factor
VMVGVFAIFATLSSIDFKEMGVGLALAVLIDATIVRAVLLPASMKLLGDWNWYLPSWLRWLPEVAPEPATHHPELYPSRLSVDVARQDARVSLALHGELDLETAPHFRERLADAEQGADTIVIDLRGVTFMDSCGIGELVGAHQRAHREGRRLVVVKGDDTPIDQILNMAKLDQTLETTADPAELTHDRTT